MPSISIFFYFILFYFILFYLILKIFFLYFVFHFISIFFFFVCLSEGHFQFNFILRKVLVNEQVIIF